MTPGAVEAMLGTPSISPAGARNTMPLSRYTREHYRDMPWKNGGGVTRELVRVPDPEASGAFLARLSIATVARSGPFSVFPGIDRVILVLEGEGMALRIDGGEEILVDRPLTPLAFSGDARTDCRLLGGPIRDFNLMSERSRVRSRLEIVRLAPGQAWTAPMADILLFHIVQGSLSLGGQDWHAEDTGLAEGEPLNALADTAAIVIVAALNRI